jgi:hypothetical protein
MSRKSKRSEIVAELTEAELKAQPDPRGYTAKEKGESLEVLSISDRIRTIDDAFRFGGYDAAIWQVHASECTSYECPMKLTGKGQDDKPVIVKLWRIKLTLRRKVSKGIEAAATDLIERMRKWSPKAIRKPARAAARKTDPHMLEVSVFDAHFGKLAWKPETGNNYDLEIAERVYLDAVKQLADDAKGFTLERILFPIGQDFFHIDNLESKTTGGTPQDADGRYGKIMVAGTMACVKAIDHLLELAPVKLIWVPGNHDRTSSYHLGMFLWAWYRNNPRVEIDMTRTQTGRRYEQYGPVVIGFAHGDMIRHEKLPAVMMHEAREMMANSRTLEIHLGHLHKSQEMVYRNTDTHAGGIRVRVLPSLSGTDKWHYDQGYVGTARAAEAYLWSKRRGYVAHFSANVSE